MKTIEIINGVTKKPEWALAEPVNFSLEEGEHIAIIGRNGAGKSMFVDMITGRHPLFPGMLKYAFTEPYNNIKHITFRDTYGGDNDRTYFLQQRWNQMEIDEETPTVGSKLEEAFLLSGEDTPERRAFQKHLYELFHLDTLLDKYIILFWRAPQIQVGGQSVCQAQSAHHREPLHWSRCRNQRSGKGPPQDAGHR